MYVDAAVQNDFQLKMISTWFDSEFLFFSTLIVIIQNQT